MKRREESKVKGAVREEVFEKEGIDERKLEGTGVKVEWKGKRDK